MIVDQNLVAPQLRRSTSLRTGIETSMSNHRTPRGTMKIRDLARTGGLFLTLMTITLPGWAATPAPAVPAGKYTLDPAHATLLFRVDHLGFSHYTARFKHFDATLDFDPGKITASKVTVDIDVASIETDYPDPLKLDFNKQLQGPDWLDGSRHPRMTYVSKKIVMTGKGTFKLEGELTLRGITRPLTLNARYNGGYAGHPMDPHARIGFSARGELRRSDFGLTYGIPAPGTTMGVSDAVEIIIEAEFSGPPLPGAPPGNH
jgi:polyisoprenoid-binding protein YceI